MICFAVIMALLAVATVSGLLFISNRVEIDPEDDDSLRSDGKRKNDNQPTLKFQEMGRMKMGTVIGKLDRKYNSIAVGDTVGIEVDGGMVTYTVDPFGGLVKEDGTRLAPKEWKGEAFEILEPGERKPEYPAESPEVIPELIPEVPEEAPVVPEEAPVVPESVSDMEDEVRRAVDEQNEERLLAMKNALEDFRREVAGLRKAQECLVAAQKSLAGDVDDAVSAVAALRSESGLLEEGAVGRGLDTFTDMELTAELKRRGYAGTVSKVIRIDAC